MAATPSESCPQCQGIVDRADNFCEVCGRELAYSAVSSSAAVAADCRECGSSQLTADGYCEQCGHKAPAERDHQQVDLGTMVGITDRGLRHSRNEDAMAMAATQTPAGPAAVAVVCDGISTSDRADEAALIAADTTRQVLVTSLRAGSTAERALATAVTAADSAVRDLADRSDSAPAATLVAGVVTEQNVTVCWVGDSRAYWLSQAATFGSQLLTSDDSLASELIAAGVLSETDAIESPHGHVVTRWLGADAELAPPRSATFQPEGPGVLLLCSDGLWNYLPEADRLAWLVSPGSTDLASAAGKLLSFALAAGGRDNITAVLIAVPSRSAGDHDTAEE